MKSILILIIIFSSLMASALPTTFPAWVTDDRIKIWAVDALVAFMKDDDFYKIQNIEVKRSYDTVNNCDAILVKLTFNDSDCESRSVQVSALAPLCNDDSCHIFNTLSDCRPTRRNKTTNKATVFRNP